MSKKNFTGGLNTLLGESPEPEPKPGRPKSSAKEITKTSQEGTKDKETRATFIVNEDQLEKLKSIAYWDRLLIKDVVAQALEDYLTNYEKKNGAIKQAPAK
jgi:hypothetical protein